MFNSLVAKLSKFTGLGGVEIRLLLVVGAGVLATILIFWILNVVFNRRAIRKDDVLGRAIKRCLQDPSTAYQEVVDIDFPRQDSPEERARREAQAHTKWKN